jgi:hypothetical protein
MAELAAIPELHPAPEPTHPVRAPVYLAADLVLSQMVLAGERLAPLRWERLGAPFQKRLGERLEEASPRLMTSLQATLAHVASSDFYLPPATVRTAALGPHAGPLARLPGSAGVARRLCRMPGWRRRPPGVRQFSPGSPGRSKRGSRTTLPRPGMGA